MRSDKNSPEADKEKRALKELLIREIFASKNDLISHEKLSNKSREKLTRSNILLKKNQATLDESSKLVSPWLKTRLFESVVVVVGLEDYLNRLLDYEGEDANSEVEVPGLLGAFHILTSASPLIVEAIHRLERQKKIYLNKKQREALESILNPKKTYQISQVDASFPPHKLEDIRSEMSRFLVDQMIKHRLSNSRQRSLLSIDFPVEKRIPAADIKGVSLEEVVSFAKERVTRGELKLHFFEDGMIWEYRGKPPVLIAKETVFLLPQINDILGYSDSEAKEQAILVSDLLKEQLRESIEIKADLGICIKCNRQPASKLAYHKKGGVIPVCDECLEKEKDLVAEILFSPIMR